MKALVTGGGGFLGRYLVEQLAARGDQVRILSRKRYPELDAIVSDVVQGDVKDSQQVHKACQGMDAVFHVAAIPGVWGPRKTYYEINTLGTRNIIQACREQGVRKLIFTSSPSVVFDGKSHEQADESLPYPEHYLCHYPETKAAAEREVLAAHDSKGLLTCALRPHLIWGPRDNHLIPRLLQRARSGRLRQVGDGSNWISMTYVENAAIAHLQAADRLTSESAVGGQAYFINDPQPVQLWPWVNQLLAEAGLPAVNRRISAGAAYRVGQALEIIYGLLRLQSEPPMTRFVALQLSQSHTYSIAKAQRDFGFEPIVGEQEAYERLLKDLPRMQASH